MLNERQSDFRPKNRCISALVDVTEEIRLQVDKRQTMSFIILLDHSKAFDTVHHSILFHKFKHMRNFSPTALKLLSSYLSNRSQSVYHGISNIMRSCSTGLHTWSSFTLHICQWSSIECRTLSNTYLYWWCAAVH